MWRHWITLIRCAWRVGSAGESRGRAKANGVPVIDCRAGERKHDLAEEHLKTTTITRAVFQCEWQAASGTYETYVVRESILFILRAPTGVKISGHAPSPAQMRSHPPQSNASIPNPAVAALRIGDLVVAATHCGTGGCHSKGELRSSWNLLSPRAEHGAARAESIPTMTTRSRWSRRNRT